MVVFRGKDTTKNPYLQIFRRKYTEFSYCPPSQLVRIVHYKVYFDISKLESDILIDISKKLRFRVCQKEFRLCGSRSLVGRNTFSPTFFIFQLINVDGFKIITIFAPRKTKHSMYNIMNRDYKIEDYGKF